MYMLHVHVYVCSVIYTHVRTRTGFSSVTFHDDASGKFLPTDVQLFQISDPLSLIFNLILRRSLLNSL